MERPRVCMQATVALALSLVACCPFVSLLGGIMGVIAYRRIVLSQGRLGGRRIALAATFIGAGLGLIGGVAGSWFASAVDRSMREAITADIPAFVRDAQQGDAPAALRLWDARATRLESNAVERFGRDTAERYGALLEFRITSAITGGSFLAPTREVAGTFVFESRELPGSAAFSILPSTTLAWPVLRLRSLVIDDPERGRLRLPAMSIPATMPATVPGSPTPPSTQPFDHVSRSGEEDK